MTKNKAWLESEIVKSLMKFSGNPNLSDYDRGHIYALNMVEGLVGQLEAPKESAEAIQGYFTSVEKAKELLEELGYIVNEKPVKTIVPDFIADWYEKNKSKYNIRTAMVQIHYQSPEVCDWVLNNSEKFARMWLDDDYEIEKKLWIVKTDKGYLSYMEATMAEGFVFETSSNKKESIRFQQKTIAYHLSKMMNGVSEEYS